MAIYAVQGKLGTGKSKFCVWMAKIAMYYGRNVAGNLDIYTEKLHPKRPGRYMRLPDKPTAADLDALGHGNPDSYDESMNGILLLDELGTWLNSRSFQDKNRAELLDWLIHARKKGWDVYFIVQDVVMIDKQVREALVEYTCKCLRMDKVKIPLIGWLINFIGEGVYAALGIKRQCKWGYLPFFHMVVARVGEGVNAVVADRWSYIGTELHDAYDTRQVFRADYPHGSHCVLPPWDHHVPVSWWARWRAGQRSTLVASRVAADPGRPRSRAMQLIAQLPDSDQRLRLAARWTAFIDKQGLRATSRP